jgi:hypothetical protein
VLVERLLLEDSEGDGVEEHTHWKKLVKTSRIISGPYRSVTNSSQYNRRFLEDSMASVCA